MQHTSPAVEEPWRTLPRLLASKRGRDETRRGSIEGQHSPMTQPVYLHTYSEFSHAAPRISRAELDQSAPLYRQSETNFQSYRPCNLSSPLPTAAPRAVGQEGALEVAAPAPFPARASLLLQRHARHEQLDQAPRHDG